MPHTPRTAEGIRLFTLLLHVDTGTQTRLSTIGQETFVSAESKESMSEIRQQ